jgi:leucyl-tRNA synthetase
MYLMFMGPFTEGGDWNDQGITGIARFVERFYLLMHSKDVVNNKEELHRAVHKTIKKVTEDMEHFQFNTCVAALMEFVNTANKTGIDRESQILMTKLIAPLAPHLAEEIWEELGEKFSIFEHSWPTFDPKLLQETTLVLPVQVNGKIRGQIEVALEASKEEILADAKNDAAVARHLEGKTLVKEIYVPGKLVSLVVKD